MKPTLVQVTAWFDEYNREVFDGTLPSVPIRFTNTRRQLGQFHWGDDRGAGIKISLFYDRTEEQYRNTLLHEMCHLYCWTRGWIREHHGPRWKRIAAVASQKTGLDIRRCDDISGLKPAAGNERHLQAAEARRNAPALLVDIDRNDYHFLVKVSRTVLTRELRSLKRTPGLTFHVYLSDAPLFRAWSTSRSLRRGYKIPVARYESEIRPLLTAASQLL